MSIGYKKLWKLLIDRDMKKKDLIALAGVSQSSVTKMGHNENVNTDVLVRIPDIKYQRIELRKEIQVKSL